jgi:hypothetical protein
MHYHPFDRIAYHSEHCMNCKLNLKANVLHAALYQIKYLHSVNAASLRC